MKKKEDYKSRLRKFGLGLGVILAIIAGLLCWRDRSAWPWLAAASGLSLLTALAFPRALTPLERLFFKVGRFMAKINTAVILTLVYFIIIAPVSVFLKLIGRDILDSEVEPARESYWEIREDPPFEKDNYDRQY